jgi:hypothetical protein
VAGVAGQQVVTLRVIGPCVVQHGGGDGLRFQYFSRWQGEALKDFPGSLFEWLAWTGKRLAG